MRPVTTVKLAHAIALVLLVLVAPVGCSLSLPSLGPIGLGEYFVTDANINGHRVALVVDTGAEMSVLFRQTAIRLGLKVDEWPSDQPVEPGRVGIGTAEECTITILSKTFLGRFGVLDLPPFARIKEEGILGWPAVKNNIVHLDGLHFRFLREVPRETSGWLTLPLRPNRLTLGIEIGSRAGLTESVEVDTGGHFGVSLASPAWRAAAAAHPHRPKSLEGYYMPGAGLLVQEQAWADRVSLGPLTLTDVPIREANVSKSSGKGPGYRATLGQAAMRRLDLVVDGTSGVAYLQPKKTQGGPVPHNRLGAVFLPRDPGKSDELTAHLLDGGPAHEAGIRDEDKLLRIGDIEVSRWGSGAALEAGRFWRRPAGTTFVLTLRRSAREFQATVVLRDLIGPGVAAASGQRN